MADLKEQANFDAQSQSSDGKSPFRAIIVGGGPVGLLMAHALNHAGIDWMILEREPQIPSPSGASVCLWPHSLRLLDQLGLLGEAHKCGMTMSTKHNHRPDGSEITVSNMFEAIESNHGHRWLLFHRAKLIEMLYSTLQEKEGRVHVGKKLTNIETHETSVRVSCADGMAVEGSIVIGCDGVHSAVRQKMHEMGVQDEAAQNQATCWGRLGLFGSKKKSDPHPMKTSYYGIIGWAPLPKGFKPGVAYETRSDNRPKQSFQVLTSPDAAYFLLYRQLDSPRTERVRYTEDDMEALAKSVADHPLNEDVTFGDLWNTRHWALMTDYQEGFVDKWSHGGRIVLAGDAVHKVTPNAAFGLNMGWQDVAVLTNLLRKQLSLSSPKNDAAAADQPDAAIALEALFKAYQQRIQTVSRNTLRFSALYTRGIARANRLYYLLEWLAPYIGGDIAMVNLLTVPIVKRAVVFDFLAEKEFTEGRYKYVNGRVG